MLHFMSILRIVSLELTVLYKTLTLNIAPKSPSKVRQSLHQKCAKVSIGIDNMCVVNVKCMYKR